MSCAFENLCSGDVIDAGGVIVEGGAGIGDVKKDKRAMREAKELAARIMELCEMARGKLAK